MLRSVFHVLSLNLISPVGLIVSALKSPCSALQSSHIAFLKYVAVPPEHFSVSLYVQPEFVQILLCVLPLFDVHSDMLCPVAGAASKFPFICVSKSLYKEFLNLATYSIISGFVQSLFCTTTISEAAVSESVYSHILHFLTAVHVL